MTNSLRTRLCALLGALGLIALYLTGLTSMGMVSTDEPRYAAIGQAMAASGDWITPRLWGTPWFEKPALLYWMTASAFRLGLSVDLAPRLPVALLSVGFLIFFWFRLRLIFDEKTATYATAFLATAAGWLAYSHVAVTDLPLSVFFTAAVLFALPAGENDADHTARRNLAAVSLALAALAKGLVPLVLFFPVLALDYRNLRRWLSLPLAIFAVIAAPWYIVCSVLNPGFLQVFFVQQQFNRFHSEALQHVQPWWFYVPAMLLLLYPWFPLAPLAFRHFRDPRIRVLASVAGWGLLFFSASINKLPGYILPLVPAVCILMAFGLARVRHPEFWFIAPLAALGLLPVAIAVLPQALAHGLRSTNVTPGLLAILGCAAMSTALVLRLRFRIIGISIFLVAAGFFATEIKAFPALDQAASARSLWLESHPTCAPVLTRGMLYSLYYYSEKELPACGIVDKNRDTSSTTDQPSGPNK